MRKSKSSGQYLVMNLVHSHFALGLAPIITILLLLLMDFIANEQVNVSTTFLINS